MRLLKLFITWFKKALGALFISAPITFIGWIVFGDLIKIQEQHGWLNIFAALGAGLLFVLIAFIVVVLVAGIMISCVNFGLILWRNE